MNDRIRRKVGLMFGGFCLLGCSLSGLTGD